jgi:hypothetical protein
MGQERKTLVGSHRMERFSSQHSFAIQSNIRLYFNIESINFLSMIEMTMNKRIRRRYRQRKKIVFCSDKKSDHIVINTANSGNL